MIYEEEIVDGVLCWRMSPRDCKGHDSWTPKTAKELTSMLLEARRAKAPVSPCLPPVFLQPVFMPAPQWTAPAPWQPPYIITCAM